MREHDDSLLPLSILANSLENSKSPTSPNLSNRHQACILTLLRILDNILSDPQKNNPKVRKIKVDNPAFWKRAGQWGGSVEFLVACGFTPSGHISQGGGVPQYLKLESEGEERRKVIIRGRESLVRLAVDTLKMNRLSLPPCPVQPQYNKDRDEKKATEPVANLSVRSAVVKEPSSSIAAENVSIKIKHTPPKNSSSLIAPNKSTSNSNDSTSSPHSKMSNASSQAETCKNEPAQDMSELKKCFEEKLGLTISASDFVSEKINKESQHTKNNDEVQEKTHTLQLKSPNTISTEPPKAPSTSEKNQESHIRTSEQVTLPVNTLSSTPNQIKNERKSHLSTDSPKNGEKSRLVNTSTPKLSGFKKAASNLPVPVTDAQAKQKVASQPSLSLGKEGAKSSQQMGKINLGKVSHYGKMAPSKMKASKPASNVAACKDQMKVVSQEVILSTSQANEEIPAAGNAVSTLNSQSVGKVSQSLEEGTSKSKLSASSPLGAAGGNSAAAEKDINPNTKSSKKIAEDDSLPPQKKCTSPPKIIPRPSEHEKLATPSVSSWDKQHLPNQNSPIVGDVEKKQNEPVALSSTPSSQPDEMALLLEEIYFELNLNDDSFPSKENSALTDEKFVVDENSIGEAIEAKKSVKEVEAAIINETRLNLEKDLDCQTLVSSANHEIRVHLDQNIRNDSSNGGGRSKEEKYPDNGSRTSSEQPLQLSEEVEELVKSSKPAPMPLPVKILDGNNDDLTKHSGEKHTLPNDDICSELSGENNYGDRPSKENRKEDEPLVEDDVEGLLDDLELDTNFNSHPNSKKKPHKIHKTDSEPPSENEQSHTETLHGDVLSQENDRITLVKTMVNEPIDRRHNGNNGNNGHDSGAQHGMAINNNGSLNVMSPPHPNSSHRRKTHQLASTPRSYSDLFRKIPLPENEFTSADCEDAKIFRRGFELCHRSLFSIWPPTDSVPQNEESVTMMKNQERGQSRPQCDTKGLTNLNLWGDLSGKEVLANHSSPPHNKLSQKSQHDHRPLILVPLGLAYSSWAYILGLKSLNGEANDGIDHGGARAGIMYSWVVSNHPNLSVLKDTLVGPSSLRFVSSLPESSISICHYVCNLLWDTGLIDVYGADVISSSTDQASELSFFVGVGQNMFQDCMKYKKAITLNGPLLQGCHGTLARAVFPSVLDELHDPSNNSSKKNHRGGQSLVWYSCRHCIRHLIVSNRLDDAETLLLDERFIRARLKSMGLLRGTLAHAHDCAEIAACLSNLLDAWRRNHLQAADKSDKENHGVCAFSPEDYDSQADTPTGAPDLSLWGEKSFESFCSISTILHEKIGELSMTERNGTGTTKKLVGGEYQRRCLKEEIGNALHIIGESIGNIGVYRVEEMEHYEEALQLKTEAFGDNQNHESIADTLYAMGCHHQRFGHLIFAQKCYEQALRIYKITLGHENLSVARVLHNIGIMYTSRNENDIAMKCFKKSMSIRTSELGDLDLSVADSLCWIGKIHRENKNFAEARECFLVAHRTKVAALGEQHPECAEILHNIGVVCDDLGLYRQSLSCYREAMSIRRANVSGAYDIPRINDVCETLNCIAHVYRVTGEHKKALQFFEQSLKRRVRIVSAALSDEDQVSSLLRTYEDVIALTKLEVKECGDKSKMLEKIGMLLVEMGKLYDHRLNKQSKALIYFQKALEVFKRMKNYKRIGDVLSYMGIVHVKKSSDQKALKCFRDSLVMRKLSAKHDTTDIAETLHNIGNCEAKAGEFEKSLYSYGEALRIKKRIYPKDNISVAKTEHCMGLALLQIGNINEALDFFKSSLKVRQTKLGNDHLDVSFSLHNVGKIYFHQNKIDNAVVCLEGAVRIKRTELTNRHISLAETEHLLASLYIKKDKCAEAIPLLKSALVTYDSMQDCDIMKSDVLDLLGKAYTQSHKTEDAILSFQQSLDIKRSVLGPENISCANVLLEIGKLKAATDDVNEALVAFKEVKRIQKTTCGKNHLSNAELLIQVGIIQDRLDNDDMAFRCFTEALRIRRVSLDRNHPLIAEALGHMGRIHQRKGDHFNSIAYFQEAINIYTKSGDESTKQESADSYRLLGISQMAVGDQKIAFSSFERCMELRESLFGPESDEWAEIAYDLGIAKIEASLHDDAFMLLDKFLIVNRKSEKDNRESLSNALFQLGKIQAKKRNLDEALEKFDEALNLKKELDGSEIGISEVLFQIGYIRESKKQYLESLVCYQESLKLRQSVVGEDEVTADTMLRIGEVYRHRQQFDLAMENLAMALESYKSTVGDDHISVANTLHSLGYVCDAKNDIHEAMKYHKEGLNIRKLNLGQNHLRVTSSLDDVAGIYQKQGENEKALKCLKEALRIRKLQLGKDSLEIATTLFGMGIVFAAIGDNDKAMECYHASLEITVADGSNPKLEAQTLHQIGCVHAAVCSYREALQNWRTSLSKYREAGFTDDHYMVACTLGNIEMAENVLAEN